MRIKLIFVCIISLLFTGCRSKNVNGTPDDPGTDMMEYADLLKMENKDGYCLVTIVNPWDTAKTFARYALVEHNSKDPEIKDAEIIHVPLKSIVLYTSVHGGVMEELGTIERTTGVVDGKYFKLPFILQGLEKGTIADLGTSSSISVEKLLSLRPDGIFMSFYEGMDTQNIDRTDLCVVKFVDNMERTPLGRAEWIKFIGALTGAREKADSIFAAVKNSYIALKNKVPAKERRPSVLVENMYEGTWYVPGGKSYQARIIADAGGDYLWKDDMHAGSLNLSFEQVLSKGRDADIWLLKVFGEDLTKESLLKQDPRYKHFKAIDAGGVYYANTGKVNLFEEFPYHPERLLEDYVHIFYPDCFKGQGKTRYFGKMNK